jgi:hypothetical protein
LTRVCKRGLGYEETVRNSRFVRVSHQQFSHVGCSRLPVCGRLPVGTAPRAITSADFNGDGKIDLAVANNGNGTGDDGGISILLGNGDGTFQATNNFTVGKSPAAIAASDFNLDGRSDLVVIDNSGVGLERAG